MFCLQHCTGDPEAHTLGPQPGRDFKISSGSGGVHEKELSSAGPFLLESCAKSLNHFSNKIKFET